MNLQAVELIIGAVLPPFIDLVNRYIKNSRVKYGVSLLASILIGVILNYQELGIENVLGSGAIVFAAAQTVYKTYWKDAKLREKIIK
jgi:hypothetical protein